MPSAQKICKLHFLRNNVIQCHIVSTLRLVHTRAANMLQPAIASRCKKLKLFSHTALHHCKFAVTSDYSEWAFKYFHNQA